MNLISYQNALFENLYHTTNISAHTTQCKPIKLDPYFNMVDKKNNDNLIMSF
jgi:hypothetical protein